MAINGMITVPMTSQMYQTMVANIQQLQPNSDGTLCITPMQVQNFVTSNSSSSSTVCTNSNSNSNNSYNTTYIMTPTTIINGNRQNTIQSIVTTSNVAHVPPKKSIPVSIITKKSNVIIKKENTVIPKKKLRRAVIKETNESTTKNQNYNKVATNQNQKVSSNNNSTNIQNKNLSSNLSNSNSSDDKKPNIITKSPKFKSKESSDENLVINLDDDEVVEVKTEEEKTD